MADDIIRRVRQVLNLEHKRGLLGNSSGEVRNTANTGYYVRIEKSPGIYDSAVVLTLRPGAIVDPRVNIPVWIGYDPYIKRDAIVGMDYTALASKGISPLHGNPNDPAAANLTSSNTLSWLYCRPHTDNTKPFYAQVYPANLVSRDEVVTFAGTEIDLSSYAPDNGYHRYVIVFLKSDFSTLEAFGSTQQLTTSALDDTDLTEAYIQRTTDSIAIRAFAMTGTDTRLNGRFVDSPYLRQLVSDMAIHKVQVGDSWFDASCKSGIVAAPGASDVQAGKFWQASGTWELPPGSASYRRYYHLPLTAFNPGASGATWTPANANTLAGFRLDAAGELLYTEADIHADWDEASDLTLELGFTVMIDNSGGSPTDTVDIKAVCYYKGEGETATKSQTVEDAIVVGACPQYTQFKHEFTIDYDAASNVVEVGDVITFTINLETDTSEVDDINLHGGSFYYNSTHVGIESGDT